MFTLVCLLFAITGVKTQEFEVPDASVEVFTPKGVRISIPDQEGIKLFAIHAHLNQEFSGLQAGKLINVDVTKVKNGRWTYYDPDIRLKPGDVVHYWTYVDYFDGIRTLGYRKEDQSYVVKGDAPVRPQGVKPRPPPQSLLRSNNNNNNSDNNCVTVANGKIVCSSSNPIFVEEFSEKPLKKELWNVQKKYAGAPDYEFVLYGNYSQTMQIEDSRLKIKPTPTEEVYGNGFVTSAGGLDLGSNCTGIPGTPDCYQKAQGRFIIPPILSSQIDTKNKFSFVYGKVEIRAKLPKGNWIYPELYLNSQQESYGKGYESGQIRIAFLGGNEDLSRNLIGGAILGSSSYIKQLYLKNIEKVSPWNDDFHTYSVIWTPDHITVSVDGSVYGNIFAPNGGFSTHGNLPDMNYAGRWAEGSEFAPFDKEMYITIGVGVGGHNFEDRNDGTKPWKNNHPLSQKNFYQRANDWKHTWTKDSSMEVDYVKVWAL